MTSKTVPPSFVASKQAYQCDGVELLQGSGASYDYQVGKNGAYEKQLPDPNIVDVIDFFSGCGGMSAGFATVRQSHIAYRVLGGVDKDESALRTYEKNINARTLRTDISKLPGDPAPLELKFPELCERRDHPLLFVGCAPCQGFSALRKGDNRDDMRNSLIDDFVSLVVRYRPDIVVMENVPEILGGRFEHYYDSSFSRLEDAGYVLEKSIVDLSLYGVPQRRKRAIIIGSLSGAIKLLPPVFSSETARTVRDAISHLPPLKAAEVDAEDENHRAPAHTERLINIFSKIPADGGDRRSIPEEFKLEAHRRLDSGSTPGFTDVYGRLRWDTPSVTITAKSRSPSSGRFLHPEQHRNITVREAAILQGFPHNYVFCGPPTQQYRQVGEAVPPLFARFIAASVLDHLSPKASRVPESVKWKRCEAEKLSLPKDTYSVIDAFCGAGGLSLGFKRAGLNSIFAFDTSQEAVQTYNHNLDSVARVGDVADPALVSYVAELSKSKKLLMVGGPPCQGFSHQRKGDPDDPRNHLVLCFADLIGKLEQPPAAVVLENVTDLELPRGIKVLRKFISRMRDIGLVPHRHVLNAADFGTAQLRRRVLMVFMSPHASTFYEGPVPITGKRWLTVGEALSGISDLSATAGLELPVDNHMLAAESDQNRQRVAYVDMGGGRLSIPSNLQLACHSGDYRGHRDVFGRMDWFLPARTITGGFDSFTRGEYAHPFRHRSITHREGARIQGFPDWYSFKGNRAAVRRQVGNAVPPGMAFAVAEAVLAALVKAEG